MSVPSCSSSDSVNQGLNPTTSQPPSNLDSIIDVSSDVSASILSAAPNFLHGIQGETIAEKEFRIDQLLTRHSGIEGIEYDPLFATDDWNDWVKTLDEIPRSPENNALVDDD